MASGADHLAFIGHGSITQWGELAGVLTIADIDGLGPARGSVVAAYSCLSGHFQHPVLQGIGEVMIRRDDGGAVAVLAPTALTGSTADASAMVGFVEQAYGVGGRRIGDVFTQVKLDIVGTSTYSDDFLRAWTLLGDPAMNLSHR